MSDPKDAPKLTNELDDKQLEKVAGGIFIDPKTKAPNYTGPKVGYKGGSISQNEINVADPSADDNNMPD